MTVTGGPGVLDHSATPCVAHGTLYKVLLQMGPQSIWCEPWGGVSPFLR